MKQPTPLKSLMKRLRRKLGRESQWSLFDSSDSSDDTDTQEGHTHVLQDLSSAPCSQGQQAAGHFLLKLLDVHAASEEGYSHELQPDAGQRNQDGGSGGDIEWYVAHQLKQVQCSALQDLQRHVVKDLIRLSPLLVPRNLMAPLLATYHSHILLRLHDLLHTSNLSMNIFLMKWVLQNFLSNNWLRHPDLNDISGSMETIDPMLAVEWIVKAKDRLCKNLQEEVRRALGRILEMDRGQSSCNDEESFIALSVDTIQCLDACPREVRKLSPVLSDHLQETCLQELLFFLKSYASDQKRSLNEEVKKAMPQMIHFLKTLKTCNELKGYVQSRGGNITLQREINAVLVNTEDSTMKILLEYISSFTTKHLREYFKSRGNKFLLVRELEGLFPKHCFGLDELKMVVEKVYQLVVHLYFRQLVRSKHKPREKAWSSGVAQMVTRDANLLHSTIKALSPDVRCWNSLLLTVSNVLHCEDIDKMKTVVMMLRQEFCSEGDLELLPVLLQWKGLSKSQVRVILEDSPAKPRRWTWCRLFICR